MLDSELYTETHGEDSHYEANRPLPDLQARAVGVAHFDAETRFSAELSQTTLLSPADEEALTRKIARARKRIRTILRKARRLSRVALAEGGRGVVPPDADFREREAVAILRFAQDALRGGDAGRQARMPRAQIRRFVTDLSAALAEYRLLRDRMIQANVRLVNALARRYHHPTLTFLDLFQEGTIGLFRAVEKYDPDRNIKFSTYATWWIWQQLGRAADTQGSLIRTPVHWNQLRRRLSRSTYGESPNGPDGRHDFAEKEGVDLNQLETMSQTFRFVSTDAAAGEDDDRPMENLLPTDPDDQPEGRVIQSSLRTHLERALQQIPERERLILRQRFGLEDDAAQTLDEIGTQLGVSRERIRQLENRALKQLRDVCSAQGLQDYLH
jgi:RNA polymerase sigma factor (sigma-70 family)